MNTELSTYQSALKGRRSSFIGASFPLTEASDVLHESLAKTAKNPTAQHAIVLRHLMEGTRHHVQHMIPDSRAISSITNADTSAFHFLGQMHLDVTRLSTTIESRINDIRDKDENVLIRVSPATLKAEERLHRTMVENPGKAKVYRDLQWQRRTFHLTHLAHVIEGGIASIRERDTLARRHLTLQALTMLLTHLQEIVDVFGQHALVPAKVPQVTQETDILSVERVHHFQAHIPPLIRTIFDLMLRLNELIRSMIERRNALNPRIDVLSHSFKEDAADIWLCAKDIMEKLGDIPGACDELTSVVTFDPRLGLEEYIHARTRNEMMKTREKILGTVGQLLEVYGVGTALAAVFL